MERSWLRVLVLGLVARAGVLLAGEPIEYNRHIRPILAQNCFACHGPDSASRQADLRLDIRERAIKVGAIVPGNPDQSEVVRRIFASDPDERMPPPQSHKVLSAQEKERIKQWVAAGAEYQPHWAFIPPKRPALPEVKNAAWCRNAIDRFILARLEEAGLAPNSEADRRTLARRVWLDLTGLPPSPAEVDAFVADGSPDAYEKLVDRLLASPHWGEHRARYWLDAARYADTHGLHFDNFREIWTYRDWVIQAFNQNMPFDRFTIEQLAGDLLPDPSLEQLVATGFHRCQVTTNEGGTIPEENLVLYTRDRTETTAQVWLGLTANCAVCHDHKYDPITQKEFYQLAAFFNNTTIGPMDGNIARTPPIITLPPPELRARWKALPGELAAVRKEIEARKSAAKPEFEKWLAAAPRPPLGAEPPAEALHLHVPLAGPAGDAASASLEGKPLTLPLKSRVSWQAGHVGPQALRLEEKPQLELAAAGDFEKDQSWSVGAWVKLPSPSASGALLARMDDQNHFRGWDLWVENGRVGTHIIHRWQEDAVKVVATEPLPKDRWNHVLVTYDGSGKAAGVKVYVNGQVQNTRPQADSLKGTIRTQVPWAIGRRSTGSAVVGLALQDIRLYRRVLSAEEVRRVIDGTRGPYLAGKAAQERTTAEKEELFSLWLAWSDQPSRQLSARLAALEKEKADIEARSPIAYVMQEAPGPAKAYVLFRGEYDKRRDEVAPNTFAFLPPMPSELPKNRLGLAKWLVRPENPLVARVTVNRFWQEVFGTGLVRTAGDFGAAGEPPSHPELLDWLAVEFRESGWDVKRLVRLLVTSATYRQSAAATPEKLEKDPQNRLLSRGPRFRMDAEMLRDFALSASGLLVAKIGGPSVKPYQPPGVWEAVAMIGSNTREYRQDHGEALYRRSLYTFWKRAAPPASMEIFNAPTRENCTVRRERTNTPLQALVTLNDPQWIEAARHLAQRARLQCGAGVPARLEFMAKAILARPLRPEESEIVAASLQRLAEFYDTHPSEAEKLLAVGESKAERSIPPAELAAWTMLANQLMNMDEALNK